MSDGPENVVLIDLRHIDQRLERIEDVRDVNRRMTSVGLKLRVDRMGNRLDRFERRLDLQAVHP